MFFSVPQNVLFIFKVRIVPNKEKIVCLPVCDQILTKVYSVVMNDFLRVYLNILYIKANVALLLPTQINTEFLNTRLS